MECGEKSFKISFTMNKDKEALIMISILGLIVFILAISSIILVVKRIKMLSPKYSSAKIFVPSAPCLPHIVTENCLKILKTT